jgi:hypothetical protein
MDDAVRVRGVEGVRDLARDGESVGDWNGTACDLHDEGNGAHFPQWRWGPTPSAN